MAHFRFLLDRSVKALTDCFLDKRIEPQSPLHCPTLHRPKIIVEEASTRKFVPFVLVTANRSDFSKMGREYVAVIKETDGWPCGEWDDSVDSDERRPKRRYFNLGSRLSFEERKITYQRCKDVHDLELLVQVESDGTPERRAPSPIPTLLVDTATSLLQSSDGEKASQNEGGIYKDRRGPIIIERRENILQLGPDKLRGLSFAQLQTSPSPAADHTFPPITVSGEQR